MSNGFPVPCALTLETWSRFGALWGWPAADLSIEQNIIDLAWHQKEFQLRSFVASWLASAWPFENIVLNRQPRSHH